MQHTVHDCHAPYSWAIEDMGSYGPGWNQSSDSNTTDSLHVPWQYQTASQLRGHPLWGTMAFYRGGGFVLDLGLDPQEATRLKLDMVNKNSFLYVHTFNYLFNTLQVHKLSQCYVVSVNKHRIENAWSFYKQECR